MKLFLSLLSVAILLAMAAFVPKAIHSRERVHEDRLLGALKVIERTIEASSDEIRRIGLYAPKMTPGPVAHKWFVDGVVTSSDAIGEQTYARFNANLTQKCPTLLDAVCWQIDQLAVGKTTLVMDGQRAGSITDVTSASEVVKPAADSVDKPGSEAAATMTATAPTSSDVAPVPQAPSPPPPAAAAKVPAPDESSALTVQIQNRLQELGYNPGPADGMMGPRTVSAILAYQRRNGLQMDGLASTELLTHLQSHTRP